MKVCYVASNLDSIHDQRLLGKLDERGYKLFVVSFNYTKIEETKNIKFYHYDLGRVRRGNYLMSLVKIYQAARFLKKLLYEIKPDILHGGQVHTDGFYCALANFHPFLLMPWGSDILIYAKKKYSWLRLMTKFALKRADAVMCDCESVKKEIIGMGSSFGAKTEIVYYAGIDLRKFNPAVDGSAVREKLGWKDEKILIMTRNFRPIYAVEYFLRALPQVIQKVSDTRVILCGDGPLKETLVNIVRELSLDSHVAFAGHVPNEELVAYLRAADIYVSTSLSDGTSSCLMEAMACALPVVVSDVPANLEWVEHGRNGFIVPRKDSTVLANSIIELLQDAELRKEFRDRNLVMAQERADLEKNLDKLERIYHRLMSEKRKRSP